MDSPMANMVWCASSSRRNSVGISSQALFGVSQAATSASQPLAVVFLQLRDPGADAVEGLAVRGQHQGVVGQFREPLDRIEEQLERIAVRVRREDADVGRDARQQHVAGDQHLQFGAIQRGMLGRVAVADDDAPVVVADAHKVSLQETAVFASAGR